MRTLLVGQVLMSSNRPSNSKGLPDLSTISPFIRSHFVVVVALYPLLCGFCGSWSGVFRRVSLFSHLRPVFFRFHKLTILSCECRSLRNRFFNGVVRFGHAVSIETSWVRIPRYCITPRTPALLDAPLAFPRPTGVGWITVWNWYEA
jgi:hypothetical protein